MVMGAETSAGGVAWVVRGRSLEEGRGLGCFGGGAWVVEGRGLVMGWGLGCWGVAWLWGQGLR